MRLINNQTGLFEEFIGINIPKYAILSHTWEEEEVSFKDMNDRSYRDKKGYQKITKTCQIASQAGYHYVWIDTCCIDKSSSAELTEAINSMYRWYQRAEICYVFLSDLPASASLDTTLQHCRWFIRGWTLQELIAPGNIFFFDQDWNNRGSKRDLVESLSNITGINEVIILCLQPLSSVCVAQKTSWAAGRETTRIEDQAYCLLGIFDVNMPLLYGEEKKAFRRLQEEIIKSTADLSIFAWRLAPATRNEENSRARTFSGVLAESPLAFSWPKSFEKLPGNVWRDFSVSNIGIKTQIRIVCAEIPGKKAFRYILPLDCSWHPTVPIGVRLRKCGPNHFIREDPWTLVEHKSPLWQTAPRVRYLLTELPGACVGLNAQLSDMTFFIGQKRLHVLQIQLPIQMDFHDVWPQDRYDDEDQLFFLTGDFIGDSAWDSAALRLSTALTFKNGQRNMTFKFQSMFYALSWSSFNIDQLQCTIVDYFSIAGRLNEAQSIISSREFNTIQVLRELMYHKIPKASAAHFEIPKTEATAVISFTPTLISDPKICRNSFWRIEFTCKVHNSKDAPKIHYGKWILDREE